METQIINLLGGPGIGKSTIAAGIFYEMERYIKSHPGNEKVLRENMEPVLEKFGL